MGGMIDPDYIGLIGRSKADFEGYLSSQWGKWKRKKGQRAEGETYKIFGAVFLFLLMMGVAGRWLPWPQNEDVVAAQYSEQEDTQLMVSEPHPVQMVKTRLLGIGRKMNLESSSNSEDFFYREDKLAYGDSVDIVVRTCLDSQPLVQAFPNFIPRPIFESFREDLYLSANMTDSSLHEANFGYTSGWMIRFNMEGIQHVQSHPKFKVVMPFFQKARNPEANAFVINYLVCHEPPEGQDAVNFHLDNSVAIMDEVTKEYLHVAHQVNVLYLDIPEGLEGGELQVWPFERGDTELDKTIVRPTENLMAEFRGDAFHRVGRMKLPDGKPRVGIVFEQYKITPDHYPYLIPFCAGEECKILTAGSQ